MPIVIKPKMSKMDKMGGGGMDIGRTTPTPSKYAEPGIEKNPTLKKKKMKMSGKMEDMREYMDRLDGIEEDTLDEGKGSYKNMMIDIEDGMDKEDFEKEYPGRGDLYDEIKQEIIDRADEDVQEPEATVTEGTWALPTTDEEVAKMNKLMQDPIPLGDGGKDAINAISFAFGDDTLYDDLATDGYKDPTGDARPIIQKYLDTVKGTFGVEYDKYLSAIADANRPGQMELPLDDDVQTIEDVQQQDIEMEDDCGCDEEAVDAMVSVPVQELQDILQLAGYENYADKIQEYANEPEEEYSSVEDQLIGLSGGLNGPKKMYPASADGDNPMNQEPREVEETMEAVEEKLYKSYKDFLEEAEK